MLKADKVKNKRELGVTSHTYHLSTQDAEAGRLKCLGLKLHNKFFLDKPGLWDIVSKEWSVCVCVADQNTLIFYEFYEEK